MSAKHWRRLLDAQYLGQQPLRLDARVGIVISFAHKQVNNFTLDNHKDAPASPTMYVDVGAT